MKKIFYDYSIVLITFSIFFNQLTLKISDKTFLIGGADLFRLILDFLILNV
jgi:hypothetical protein